METFKKHFTAMAPLAPTLQLFLDHQATLSRCPSSVEAQDEFAECVSSDAAFPVGAGYKLKLLNLYASKVERLGGFIESDNFSEVMVAAMSNAKLDDGMDPEYTCCQSFADARLGGVIASRIYPRHNDVGLRLWEAGYILAEFICDNPSLFAGKTVTELGAGCGLTGMIAGSVGRAKRVFVTDYTVETLDNMRHNVEINEAYLAVTETPLDVMTVHHLDWSQTAKNSTDVCVTDADVMMAADCVYDVCVIPCLVETVSTFLSQSREKVCFIATTFRNEKTFALFISELEKAGVQYDSLVYEGNGTFEGVWNVCERERVKMHMFRNK
jgi:hypothetical protein